MLHIECSTCQCHYVQMRTHLLMHDPHITNLHGNNRAMLPGSPMMSWQRETSNGFKCIAVATDYTNTEEQKYSNLCDAGRKSKQLHLCFIQLWQNTTHKISCNDDAVNHTQFPAHVNSWNVFFGRLVITKKNCYFNITKHYNLNISVSTRDLHHMAKMFSCV